MIQAAIVYYGAYPGAIDERVEFGAREGEAARAVWFAGALRSSVEAAAR